MMIIVHFGVVALIGQVLGECIPREALVIWLLARLIPVNERHHTPEGIVFSVNLFSNPSIAFVGAIEILSPQPRRPLGCPLVVNCAVFLKE